MDLIHFGGALGEGMMEPVSLGTTIMAATFEGGVILGADSRTSSGNYVGNRVSDKLTALSDRIYVCRSGSAADTQNMASYVQLFLAQHGMELGRDPDVKTAAKLASTLCYQNKAMLQAGLIVAGWDKYEGGSVYGIPLGGTLISKLPFAIGGSGGSYIYGFCDKNWRAGMSQEECLRFVRQAISLAIARDGSSGGVIRTVTISQEGVKRDFLGNEQLPRWFGELPAPGAPVPIET
eukprot:jgi/Botrbrau1/10363/Bobra.146_2s0002.1